MTKKDGKSYLKETQPEVWQVAYDMACELSAGLAGRPWRERAFLVDAFVSELVIEMMGADGLNELAELPIAEVVSESDPGAEQAGQIVASVRSILTAALLDLPPEDISTLETVESEEQALLLFISELAEHNDAARTWAASQDLDKVLTALEPLAGLTVLLLADHGSTHSIEPLGSTEKLRDSLHRQWSAEDLTRH